MYVEKVSNTPACCRRGMESCVIYPVKFRLRRITIEAAEKEPAERGYIIQPAPFAPFRFAPLNYAARARSTLRVMSTSVKSAKDSRASCVSPILSGQITDSPSSFSRVQRTFEVDAERFSARAHEKADPARNVLLL